MGQALVNLLLLKVPAVGLGAGELRTLSNSRPFRKLGVTWRNRGRGRGKFCAARNVCLCAE